ncbi:filamentous hemagglutinin N-terminal domain-containing protein [Methylophilus methylotrophus]|uniref:two-partner secretion domain-containing protein n=1 Tax=Methylophilus methylotrophus TaxID=17 RepID=UPI000F59826F|nr:filamentous hemagglutinin N-terminal domain-containing protein [Methylophilus methylotrophus]
MKAASLNHVYRLIWSHVQNAWTVVAEIAKASGKKSVVVNQASASTNKVGFWVNLSSTSKLRCMLVSALTLVGMVSNAYAAPMDPIIIHGSQTVTVNGNVMDINQHSDKLNVSWGSFDIAKGETVNLIQPLNGAALFSIRGHAGTEIYGQLNATGTLLLINPNGVLFGAGSEVNVGNIVASTLTISNDDFLNGRYHFTGGDNAGSVINQGVIKAKDEGYIVMLGKKVENTGTLVANNGSVVLAAAKEAVLDFYGNGLVRANLTGQAVEGIVKNSGLIQANGGLVQMATNARSAAINISGIVEANQLVERDGMIRLEGGDNAKVQVSGQLIAKGENTTGGTIEVTGEQVALLDGAVLDASGDTGGGKVLVGGDYQGKNDAVYNSRTTYIAQGATIKADALQQGDGGKVIVWADDLTRYYGSISAQGGAISGNGGFVEVSGKVNLDFHGKVNVAADNGLGGTLLLDPTNIVLSNSPSTLIPITDVATEDVAFANNAGGATTTINVNDVNGFSQLWLQATNDITINNALIMTNPVGSIKFEANNDINVNADIKAGFLGSVSLVADADNSGVGNIAIGANITGGSGIANATDGVFLSAATITHTAGNISSTADIMTGIGGSITINTTGAANLGSANIISRGTTIGAAGNAGGAVIINADSLTMSGNIDASGSAAALSTESGGQGGTVTINTANNANVGNIVTSSGNSGADFTAGSLSGEVNIASTNGAITTGNINSNGGANGIGAKVTLTAANSVTAGNINTSAGLANVNTDGKSAADVNITAGTNITVGDISATGANGNGTNKSGGVAGAVTLQAKAGNIDMGAINNVGGDKTGTGVAGLPAKILVQAGQDIITNGDITNNHTGADAVQLVAGGKFDNTKDINISTNGNWTVYSNDPTNDTKGAKLLAAYDYKQYGTAFGGALLGTGNGFVHQVTPNVTVTLTGTSTKVFDGNNAVTDLSGLTLTTNGVLDNDVVTFSPAALTSASFDTAAVGTGKSITTGAPTITSAVTFEGKVIYNAYTSATNNSTATGSITAAPVTLTGFASPRDDAGLGGLIPNNPVLNTMFIVSLNPAAGDEEDLDAVACPTPEDRLGSTPILSSGVKLPDGVNSNCI